jgi:hypothetical protein
MNRLWFPIGFHFGWNFIPGYLYGLPVSRIEFDSFLKPDLFGADILTGGSYGHEGSITGIFARMIVFLLLYLIEKKNNKIICCTFQKLEIILERRNEK